MHYKNGREAKIGDKVIGKDCNGNPIGGTLVNIVSQSDTCNGYIVLLDRLQLVSLKDCLNVEDL